MSQLGALHEQEKGINLSCRSGIQPNKCTCFNKPMLHTLLVISGQSTSVISLFYRFIVRMKNCVDPDQLASDEASCSGSTLF